MPGLPKNKFKPKTIPAKIVPVIKEKINGKMAIIKEHCLGFEGSVFVKVDDPSARTLSAEQVVLVLSTIEKTESVNSKTWAEVNHARFAT